MSELEVLTAQANELSSRVDFWNNAVLVALLITALAAASIVVSQRLAFMRAKQLSDKQEELSTAKEAELRIQIANVAAVAQVETARLSKIAEDERLARIKIEEKIAPRRFTAEQKKTIASKLRVFAGQKTFLRPYKGDTESIELAEDIFDALGPRGAGWDVSFLPIETEQTGADIISGILVGVFPAATKKDKEAAKNLVAAISAERLTIFGPQELPAIREFHISNMKITPERHIDLGSPMVITIGKKPN